jgi:hypothetical protein
MIANFTNRGFTLPQFVGNPDGSATLVSSNAYEYEANVNLYMFETSIFPSSILPDLGPGAPTGDIVAVYVDSVSSEEELDTSAFLTATDLEDEFRERRREELDTYYLSNGGGSMPAASIMSDVIVLPTSSSVTTPVETFQLPSMQSVLNQELIDFTLGFDDYTRFVMFVTQDSAVKLVPSREVVEEDANGFVWYNVAILENAANSGGGQDGETGLDEFIIEPHTTVVFRTHWIQYGGISERLLAFREVFRSRRSSFWDRVFRGTSSELVDRGAHVGLTADLIAVTDGEGTGSINLYAPSLGLSFPVGYSNDVELSNETDSETLSPLFTNGSVYTFSEQPSPAPSLSPGDSVSLRLTVVSDTEVEAKVL